MKPFTTLKDALKFIEDSPPTSDRFEVTMADGFTVDGKPDRRLGSRTMGEMGLITALLRLDFKQEDCQQHEGFKTYRFRRVRMSSSEDEPFPPDFKPQSVTLPDATALSSLPPSEIAFYFERHPEVASALVAESENKRFAPSTFVTRKGGGYRVGWFSVEKGQQCVMQFSKVSDAATDYLLFSLGTGRWYGRDSAHDR